HFFVAFCDGLPLRGVRKSWRGQSMIRNFRTLDLAIRFYRLCLRQPLVHPEKGQLRRASLSVINNLGEGWDRRTPGDRRHFFDIAFGSLRESQVIIVATQLRDPELLDTADRLGG